MGLVEHIHPILEEAEYSHVSIKLMFVACSLMFFVLVFTTSAVLSSLTKTYMDLRQKEKMFWNLAIVRSIFGIFAINSAIWAIFFDKNLEKDIVFAKSSTSYFIITVTVGFFVFECMAMVVSDYLYKRGSVLLNVHHWMSLALTSSLLLTESSHCLGTRGLMLEMTTPFSAVCWILLKAGKSGSLLWKVNQFVLVHAFHLRSVVEFYLWFETYKHWNQLWKAMPLSMFVIYYVSLFLTTFAMTPYWTLKKTQQMINPIDWNFGASNNNFHDTKISKYISVKQE